MMKDFRQIGWDEATQDDCRQIVRLAVREDLGRQHDWTTVALVPQDATGSAAVVARDAGIIAGLPAAELAFDETNANVGWNPLIEDGQRVDAGQTVARVEGSTRDVLTTERIVLNLLGRLSGIATATRQYVDAIAGATAAIYDTRKTTPGWRRLEKYAVSCGGGRNHRTGLFDAILIKDNHLATDHGPAEAVQRVKTFAADTLPAAGHRECLIIEVEVDSLDQLSQVLPVAPDIVLLDNMSVEQLRDAVAMRDGGFADIQLEASGGVTLATVASIAAAGVDRISVGALTHSAVSLDLGLDWLP